MSGLIHILSFDVNELALLDALRPSEQRHLALKPLD